MEEEKTQIVGEIDELPRISIEGCEVVRRQFLSHMKDMVVTIRPDGIIFNTTCLVKLDDAVHIQMLVDRKNQWLIIRACDEEDKDGQRWCNVSENGTRKTRKLTGRDFGTLMYDFMKWTKGYYYKVCGSLAMQEGDDGELLLVFELVDAEKYPMTSKSRQAAGVDDGDIKEEELARLIEIEKQNLEEKAERKAAKERGEKPKRSKRTSEFPNSWEENSFGALFSNHTNRVKINQSDNQISLFSTLIEDNQK